MLDIKKQSSDDVTNLVIATGDSKSNSIEINPHTSCINSVDPLNKFCQTQPKVKTEKLKASQSTSNLKGNVSQKSIVKRQDKQNKVELNLDCHTQPKSNINRAELKLKHSRYSAKEGISELELMFMRIRQKKFSSTGR